MSDLPTLYNSLVDTLSAIARATELETDELSRKITQAIRTNIPDKADDLSEGSSPQERVEESAAYALASQALNIASTALEKATEPEVLPDGRVFTNQTDLVDGFLDEEITVTPLDASFSWLEKSVVPVGSEGDNRLLLEHGPWDEENLEDNGDVIGDIDAGNGVTVGPGAAPSGVPYIEFTRYFDQYDANNHSQLVANPAYGVYRIILPDYLVKVEAGGTAGYLKNKVSTTPAAGDNWLEQSVVNDKLLIEHSTLNPAYFGVSRPLVSIIDSGSGGVTIGSSTPASGRSYFKVNKANYEDDDAGHSETNTDGVTNEYVSWLALPSGATAGDMLRWDGSKWATIAAPSSSSDYVLTSQSGTISWVELDTFACPS